MGESSAETKKKIVASAKNEFLAKGFMNASLRTIAANAGVTTGAMYRHFKDKDALFCALVDTAIDITTKAVMSADVNVHMNIDNPLGKEHKESETQILTDLLDYIYSDFDAFTLLLFKSSGSTHEDFVNEICDLYTKNCIETFNWMYNEKYAKNKVDDMTAHVLASSLINAFTELIAHKIPKEQAVNFIINIRDFFHFGILHVMGIPCTE